MPKKTDEEMTRFTLDITAKTRTMLEEIMRDYGVLNQADMIRVLIRERYEILPCRDEKK